MSMEPEARDFLRRVALSLFLGLCWLMVMMTLGIYFDLLPIYGGRPSVGNVVFYVVFLGSGALYLRFLFRTWRKKFPHG
jgi:hypothetical protein